ncbi:MAG: 3-hydroxyacyl-ACP dehydratase FabZ family protein [Kofleriaceae bacterium]
MEFPAEREYAAAVRYLLLDAIHELVVGRSATGVKCVTLTDEILRDHFRWDPVLPGALLIEAMSQLAGALIEETAVAAGRSGELAVMVGVEKARFLRGARPGDRLALHASYVSDKQIAAALRVEAKIEDELAADAELRFVVNAGAPAELVEERARLRQLWRTGKGYALPGAPRQGILG